MDIVTYALSKKLIATSATGIKSITLDPSNDKILIFKLGDGSETKINLPIKDNCLGYEFVDNLPSIASAKQGTLYLIPEDATLTRYKQYVLSGGKFIEVGGYTMPIASETTLGGVMVDGTSIIIDSNGVISVKKDYVVDNAKEALEEEVIEQPDIGDLFFD